MQSIHRHLLIYAGLVLVAGCGGDIFGLPATVRGACRGIDDAGVSATMSMVELDMEAGQSKADEYTDAITSCRDGCPDWDASCYPACISCTGAIIDYVYGRPR